MTHKNAETYASHTETKVSYIIRKPVLTPVWFHLGGALEPAFSHPANQSRGPGGAAQVAPPPSVLVVVFMCVVLSRAKESKDFEAGRRRPGGAPQGCFW